MLFWASVCLGISYFTAKHFPFKPLEPLPPKKNQGGAHIIVFASGRREPQLRYCLFSLCNVGPMHEVTDRSWLNDMGVVTAGTGRTFDADSYKSPRKRSDISR